MSKALWAVLNVELCWILVDAAGQNKQHTAAKNVAKLDRETEELHHEHVGLDVSRLIQQGRQAKGMTQKELATVWHFVTMNTAYFVQTCAKINFCLIWFRDILTTQC